MKKVLKVLLSFAMMFALAACGNGGDTAKEQFIVGMEVNYAPFNWAETKESDTTAPLVSGVGYADGYDVQIAQMIADELGRELVIKQIEWDGLQPALQAGEIDAIIAGMTATAEREDGIDFTTPYFDGGGLVMLVKKGSKQASYTKIEDFAGEVVMGQKGTAYDTCIDQIKGVKHATPKAKYPELVLALQNGDCVGVTAEMPVAMGICQANDDLTYVSFVDGHQFDYDSTVSIGLKEGTKDTDFFKAVQAALDKISNETKEKTMDNCVSRAPTSEE